jgi:hypothetical protein
LKGRNADLEAGFSRGSQIGPVSEENIATLCSLGFSREQALMALLQTGDNLPFASNLLFDGY